MAKLWPTGREGEFRFAQPESKGLIVGHKYCLRRRGVRRLGLGLSLG